MTKIITKYFFLILTSFLGMTNCVFAGDYSDIAGVTPEMTALIMRCAPTVHPETMAALVSAESHGHQYAITDAGPVNLPWSQRKSMVRSYYMGSIGAAVAKAQTLLIQGHTVSLGLAQINNRNLAALGLTISQVFEPCTNLMAGARIITDFYLKASERYSNAPQALRAAISAYNSGDWVRGENEGYVNLVMNQRGKPLSLRKGDVPRDGICFKKEPNGCITPKTNGENAPA